MSVHIVDHPLIKHKLGVLRGANLPCSQFRAITNELCRLLAYEATRDLPVSADTVEGWAGTVPIERIAGRMLTVVPILRAGLGMMDGFMDLVPGAKVSVVGMFRNEETLEPVSYYSKLATNIDQRIAFILDPMLATGGSLCATVALLKKAGCTDIRGLFLVAAPEGIHRLEATHPEVRIFTCAVDNCLNEHGYILPGLGDAGDKIFGTV